MIRFKSILFSTVLLIACSGCEPESGLNVSSTQRPLSLLSADETTDFALQAQALLGGYDLEALTEVTRHTHFASRDDFGSSKPSVTSNGIEIYSYYPTLKEQGSEYDYVWYKFKAPEAIDDVLSLPKLGKRVAADKILELAFSEARKLVPDAAAQVDAMGYTFSFGHRNIMIGSQWLSSKLTIELQDDKNVYLNAPTLVSSKIIPVVGGMSYCKVFTPSAAASLIQDLANGNHDKIPFKNAQKADLDLAAGPFHSAANVSWNGLVGDAFSQKAVLFVDNDYRDSGEYQGTCIISPGGFIPAISMRGLAKEIATEGYVVFIIEYPTDLAFWEAIDLRESSYLNLTNLIKQQKTEKIQGLFPSVASFYSGNTSPVIIVGHSLGGAALGPVVFGKENPFDRIILSGVASYIKAPWQKTVRADNVDLFFGSKESKTEDTIEKVRKELSLDLDPDSEGIYRSSSSNRTMQFIDGLNHFGIISDMSVGMDMIRNSDGDGKKPSESVQIFVEHLADRGLL